jgi:hypothetical protein
MVEPVDSHVSWDEVVGLARQITGDGRDSTLGLRLARLVVQFHAQTVGAAPTSSRIIRPV